MSKPEVYRFSAQVSACCDMDSIQDVVLASDYDALAAQRNELLVLLRDVREELAIDGTESWIRALMARIDATLAKLEENQC